jgi:hypothetical protein
MKYEFICRACGSNSVVADAYAQWDIATQSWIVVNCFDKGAFCNPCGVETRLDKVESEPDADIGVLEQSAWYDTSLELI